MNDSTKFIRVGDRIINLALVTNASFCDATEAEPATLVIYFIGNSTIRLGGDDAQGVWRYLKALAFKTSHCDR